MNYTASIVKNIFTDDIQGFRIDMQPIVEIAFLLNQKLIFVDEKIISTKKIYLKYISDINNGKIAKIDVEGGGISHQALKLIGNDFLKSLGSSNNNYELEFEGYIPDVISKNKEYIVECGNTNPDKLFHYFVNRSVKKVIVISYPKEGEKNIKAYIFIPSDDLADFLKFYMEENLKKIKRIKLR